MKRMYILIFFFNIFFCSSWAVNLSPPCNVENVLANLGAKTTSTIPGQPCVPTLGYDDSSITLVWPKPVNYTNIVDYNVYLNGKKVGSSVQNAKWAVVEPYITQFYKEPNANTFHTKIQYHSFFATGLASDTVFTFTIRSVDAKGVESVDSAKLVATTAPSIKRVFNVATLGALGDGKTLNTKIMQKAIDDCAKGSTTAYGCKVLIPANHSSGKIFLTGALFLQSNMTLEVAEGAVLRGSTNASDYPLSQGYQIYSYFSNNLDDRRVPALLNVLNPKHMNGPKANKDHQGYDEGRGVFQNIRVTGKGTLDGNGWVRRATDTTDEVGNKLATFSQGSSKTWQTLGLLAKDQMEAAQKEVAGGEFNISTNANYYSTRRSSLTTFRGVRNLYFGNLKLTNPAFHGVMFLECENIVFTNTMTQTFDINNADGVEFGNSNNAVVFNNFVDSGDDCINFAAGQGKDYESGVAPQQMAWVFNNYAREGHGGFVTGSHTGAWIQDILAEDNVMFLTDNGLRIKSTPQTGGGVRRVLFRDTAMREIGTKNNVKAGGQTFKNNNNGNPFVLTLAYSAGSSIFTNANKCAQFVDITVQRVTVDNGSPATGSESILIDGYDGIDSTLKYPETFHENVIFEDIKIANAKPTSISRLKASSFQKVEITNWGNGKSPWNITNSSGLKFVSVSPTPQSQ